MNLAQAIAEALVLLRAVGKHDAAAAIETAAAPPEPIVPSREQIRAEIESGPLAAELAPYWATVFPPPCEPRGPDGLPRRPDEAIPGTPQWLHKEKRAGWLEPDAAFEIARRLQERCAALGWASIDTRMVLDAQRSTKRT